MFNKRGRFKFRCWDGQYKFYGNFFCVLHCMTVQSDDTFYNIRIYLTDD